MSVFTAKKLKEARNFAHLSQEEVAKSLGISKRKLISIEANEDKKEHKNLVIAEVLSVIENIILFKFSNYFLRFSSEYKKIRNVDRVPNDWYEYVEYGTTNPLSILLQQCGFTREASSYIKDNQDTYVVIQDGSLCLRRTLLECENNTVRKEARELIYNMPELFE